MKNLFIAEGQISRAVKNWLILGLVMIFFQVVIGGITRLTESGLSITEWDIVWGTFPPMSDASWEAEFDLYKATPQYQKLNQGMEMGSIFTAGTFKFIYFWEYFHRLWARMMGFVFIIPFFFFLFTRRFSRPLFKRLIVVFLLAALVASVGWIMVASGLEDRPWVDAYKLAMHLSLAFILFSYLFWTTLKAVYYDIKVIHNPMLKRWGTALTFVLAIQIVLGGIMSGSKAGLSYPTWPDMNGEMVPSLLLDAEEWNVENFVDYDKNGFFPTFIQFFHRGTAYLLTIMGLGYFFYGLKQEITPLFRRGLWMWISMLVIQILLGIITVLNSRGSIPVDWGVLHQGGALLLLTTALFINFQTNRKLN